MQLQINQEKKEIKQHGSFDFPVRISEENLASYERGSFFWHWHPEIELTLILDGSMDYQVNENIYRLQKGQGLFCNANMLHAGKAYNDLNCIYAAITFDPKIIYGFESSLVQNKYVMPLVKNTSLSSMVFDSEIDWQKDILSSIESIWKTSQFPEETSEFEIQQALSHIWMTLYKHVPKEESAGTMVARDQDRLRTMLSFIHSHYSEKVTLDDLAKEVNLCKSECCRFFKKHMQMSIFDYLMKYRIEKSLPLLQNTNDHITDISLRTGFLNSCYFSKVFKQEMGCSPRDYRLEKHSS